MYTDANLSPRTAADRQGHVLRMVGDCRSFAAHRLVAEEHVRAAAEYAARRQLLREAGVPSPGIAARLVSFRTSMGSALIRIGERLHGGSVARQTACPASGV